jgi:hypothetical protein
MTPLCVFGNSFRGLERDETKSPTRMCLGGGECYESTQMVDFVRERHVIPYVVGGVAFLFRWMSDSQGGSQFLTPLSDDDDDSKCKSKAIRYSLSWMPWTWT